MHRLQLTVGEGLIYFPVCKNMYYRNHIVITMVLVKLIVNAYLLLLDVTWMLNARLSDVENVTSQL